MMAAPWPTIPRQDAHVDLYGVTQVGTARGNADETFRLTFTFTSGPHLAINLPREDLGHVIKMLRKLEEGDAGNAGNGSG